MKEKKLALFINLAKIPRAYEKLTFSKENVKGHTYVDNFSGRRKERFICNISKMKKKKISKGNVSLTWNREIITNELKGKIKHKITLT